MSILPESSARSSRPAVNCPLVRRWRISGAHLTVGQNRSELDGRLLAGFLGNHARAILAQQCSDHAGERLRQLCKKCLMRGRGQILARDHGLANRREMAEARDDPVERAQRDLGAAIFDQDETSLGRSDLSDGCRLPRPWSFARCAIAICISGRPVATASTRSASTSSGECCSTQQAMSG